MFEMKNADSAFDVHIRAGDSHRGRGDWASAIPEYQAALDVDPISPKASPIWVQLGHALKETGQLEAAGEAYERARKLTPDSSDVHLQIGHLLKIRGQIAAARASYLHAYHLDQNNTDVQFELEALGVSLSLLTPAKNHRSETRGAGVKADLAIIIEITDLLDYLQRNEVPSGIQRVQWQLAASYVTMQREGVVIRFAYFNRISGYWTDVPAEAVRGLLDTSGNVSPFGVRDTAQLMLRDAERAPAVKFLDGDILFNPGASWSISNYFLAAREARREYGATVVTFIHDCIPLLYPEYCTDDVIQDYVSWFPEVLSGSDLIIANSVNTKRDVENTAQQMGLFCPPIAAVPLNGSFEQSTNRGTYSDAEMPVIEKLSSLGLFGQRTSDYVLFVSTVEPRKNHVAAFQAWSALLKKYGSKVPYLVCSGLHGWHSNYTMSVLDRNRMLASKVIMTGPISDRLIDDLYTGALFTVYPSLYEGWGLPVSESISYGKVPLVADNSSLREAGGDIAVYFDTHSVPDFVEKAGKLAFDDAFRSSREKALQTAAHLRSWSEVASAMITECMSAKRVAKVHRAVINSGVTYTFAKSAALQIGDVRPSGVSIRSGLGWWQTESWGTWTKGREGKLSFQIARLDSSGSTPRRVVVFLELIGSPNIDNEVEIKSGSDSESRHVTLRRNRKQWVSITAPLNESDAVDIKIIPRDLDDFGFATAGKDTRVVGVGIISLRAGWESDYSGRMNMLEELVLGGAAARQDG